MSNEVLTLVAWFKNAQHVNVTPNWVQKSVSDIRRNSRASVLSLNEIRQSLWALWLNSDLNLNPNSCLPQDVTTQKKQMLNGNFILQLQEIKDISQSAYSQLMKIPNKNPDPDEAQEFEAKWKPKANRMMWLTLTDGKEIVMGMEYEPIPALTSSISPGCKISIFGSIQCRFGVLLLTKNNMKIVGGVVESLKEKNSTVNVLTRLLGNDQISEMMKDNHEKKSLVEKKDEEFEDSDFPDDVIDLDEIERLERSALESRESENPGRWTNSDVAMAEEWENIDDFNEEWENVDDFKNFPDEVIEIADSQKSRELPENHQNFDMEIPDEILNDFDDDMSDFETEPPKSKFKSNPLNSSIQPTKRLKLEPKPKPKPNYKILKPQKTEKFQKIEKFATSGPQKSENLEKFFKPSTIIVKKTAPINVQLPYVYIIDIIDTPKSSRKFVYTVRGFVTTLMSPLEHKETKWTLKACVNDGTASLDVEFDNAFLEKLIGIKGTELRQLSQKAKLDKSYQQQIVNGLRSCQTFLTDFSGFFDIEFQPNNEPKIISSRDLTPDDVRALDLSVDDTLLPLSLRVLSLS